jgi:hypothetical protein
MAILSPTLTWVTFEPTSVTMPALSGIRIIGFWTTKSPILPSVK